MPKNVLFIMCDQLRADYLGCAGHPTIKTPNIDALAARGVRFSQSYVQSPICGPSRMSTYTGRYVRSHGSDYNQVPLRVGEWTLGDHLGTFGGRAVLCGKTHMKADLAGMARLGIDPASRHGRHIAEGGFNIWDRLDGLHPPGGKAPSHYNDYLRRHGMDGDSPWQDWVASVVDTDGTIKNGWLNKHIHLPARVPEEHSETAYSTNRAIEFMDQADDAPWCLHLSYIKPHWPLAAPAPYHDMYGPADVVPVVNPDPDLESLHPINRANHPARYARIYDRDGAREQVIAAYMGLITQVDDHVGRIVTWLEDRDQLKDTLIIFTSDHGDYLGDHGMGEKMYFHDASAKVPLIIYDPDGAADATRGTVDDSLTEAIDLVPTIVDFMGGQVQPHILEGRSLVPLLRGQDVAWRDCAFSQATYSRTGARDALDQPTSDCDMIMAYDGRWKYVYCQGQRPMLYDLKADPDEVTDLGANPDFAAERDRLQARVFEGMLDSRHRVTEPDSVIENEPPEFTCGILIGFWDDAELERAMAAAQAGV